ncbi:MAG TPA: rhomboid family intramembrane serine protease [Gammaproteobacteria bacterium]|nr:rhomboid family intramembrane serine protease [Gammaproteobacteria bacterium]
MIPLRDENPVGITPVVTWLLVGACVAAFLWQMSAGAEGFNRIVFGLGVIPAVLLGHAQLPEEIAMVPPVATVFTSMFLHGGWLHLAGNMLYLWIFGDNIEERMGGVRFLVFYLACGVAAVLAQALPAPEGVVPMVGASGAISGVLGAYLLLFPRARVLVLVPLGFILQAVRLPALWVLGLWFGIQLLSSLMAPEGEGGVAFRAHLGGFIAGLALAPLFLKRSRRS